VGSRKNTKTYEAMRSRLAGLEPGPLELIAEEPLMIRIEERPYSVVMRTPGDEVCHAVGFCLGEGIIDSPDDISAVGYDEHLDPNQIDVWLTPERRERIPDLLQRKSYVSQTSCGVCGKRMIEEIYQDLTPAKSSFEIDVDDVFECIDLFSANQKHYQTTRGSHAALILDRELHVVAMAEDVGRHNALDKAIGKTLMSRRLSDTNILVLSSRNSHELVQKAARARLQMMINHSRPTSLAVEMASALNMTLVFPDKGAELVIACGENRIRTNGAAVADQRAMTTVRLIDRPSPTNRTK